MHPAHLIGMKLLSVASALVISGVGLWLVPQERVERYARDAEPIVAASSSTPGAVATAGPHEGAAETASGEVLTEIETITGANDGLAFVGRRVDLHVDVLERANDRAFWVGSRDNRLLVVLERDVRDHGAQGHGGQAGHGIIPVRGGQRAAIAGVVRPVRKLDERNVWRLTKRDEQELLDRKIFIRAEVVSAEGHAAH